MQDLVFGVRFEEIRADHGAQCTSSQPTRKPRVAASSERTHAARRTGSGRRSCSTRSSPQPATGNSPPSRRPRPRCRTSRPRVVYGFTFSTGGIAADAGPTLRGGCERISAPLVLLLCANGRGRSVPLGSSRSGINQRTRRRRISPSTSLSPGAAVVGCPPRLRFKRPAIEPHRDGVTPTHAERHPMAVRLSGRISRSRANRPSASESQSDEGSPS